jgi:hypothetical protein
MNQAILVIPELRPLCVLLVQLGTRRPFWYPFSSHYWRPKPADDVTALQKVLLQQQQQQQQQNQAAESDPGAAGLAVDSDVAAEEAGIRDLLQQRTGGFRA